MDTTFEQSSKLDLLGTASALGLCVIFGSNAIAIKLTYTGMSVYFTAGMRFLVASACLTIWAKATGQNLLVTKDKWIPLLIISLSFSAQLLLFYFGLSKTTAARSILIMNLQPFFVLFLAHFFIPEDRINLRKVLGIALAFAGLISVFLDNTVAGQTFRIGDLVVLIGAFIWGCNAVYTKRMIKHYEPIQIALFPMFISLPISFTASLLFENEMIRQLDAGIIGSFFYQCFVAAFGYVIWNSLLKKYGTVTLHSFIFIMPITGVLLGGFILDEPITLRLLAGLLFVVTGLLVVHGRKQKSVRPIFTISRNV